MEIRAWWLVLFTSQNKRSKLINDFSQYLFSQYLLE
jgi:hypothetical protein